MEGRDIWCKRDDLIHPVISGNKWRKLKATAYWLVKENIPALASFGGAYSNHLHALAYVCKVLNIQFHAVVRAHPQSPLTPTLSDIKNWGSRIHFVSRDEYRLRNDEAYIEQLKQELQVDYVIPEGGSNEACIHGVEDIIEELNKQHTQVFDYILAPVASGGTLAGLISGVRKAKLATQVLGIAVLKGKAYLTDSVESLLPNTDASYHNWEIFYEASVVCGGYAKLSKELEAFGEQFSKTHFTLDRVYNTKSFFALKMLLQQARFRNKKILILQTGGLQGNRKTAL